MASAPRQWPGRCEFPLTASIERGHVSTFGRKCKQCKQDMTKEPDDALWCGQCKALDARRDDIKAAHERLKAGA